MAKFNFSGLPENEEFEIEGIQEVPKSPLGISPNDMGGLGSLFKSLFRVDPEQQLGNSPSQNERNNLVNSLGDILNTLSNLENIKDLSDPEGCEEMAEQFLKLMGAQIEEGDFKDEKEEKMNENLRRYQNNLDKRFFDPSRFGSIFSFDDPDLLDDFWKIFPMHAKEKYFERQELLSYIQQDKVFSFNSLDAEENSTQLELISSIDNFHLRVKNKNFLLFYGEKEPEGEKFFQGLYLIAFKDEEDKIVFFMPGATNTFNREEKRLYNNIDDPEFFIGGRFQFDYIDLVLMEAQNSLFTEKTNNLTRLFNIGEVSNVLIGATGSPSDLLEVGRLKFYEDYPEFTGRSGKNITAQLIKKDLGLTPSDETARLFVRFPEVKSQDELTKWANYFFKINFNENPLFVNADLSVENGKLVIDVNPGNIFAVKFKDPEDE